MFNFVWPSAAQDLTVFFVFLLIITAFISAWIYLMHKLIMRARPFLDEKLLARGLGFKNYVLINIDKILIAILMSWLSPIGLALAIYFLRNDYLRIEELEEKKTRL